jgi:murein L,D-transpeptidase YcbB/YkuD
MKYLFIVSSILLSRLIACDNLSGSLGSTSSDSAKGAVSAPLRDLSITSANSYSDLFLDSTSLENFIRAEKINDSIASGLRNFYSVRNYQFAWFNSEGLTEQGKGFWSLYDYANDHGDSIKENKSLASKMDTLTEADTLVISISDSSFIQTELSLTKEFIKYAHNFKNHTAFTDPYHFVPVKKLDAMQLADSILNKQADSVNASTDSATNLSRPYNLLKEQLRTYYDDAQKGGWQPIPSGQKKFKKGSSSPVVAAIKKRLILTGEYQGNDTTQVYNDSLATAIKSYKIRHGFDSTTIVTDSLIKDMNIPVTQRIEQILINLNRMMWIPEISSQQLIEVNIPEYMMSVYDDKAKTFEMKVVVGKEGANTTMFSGDLNQIVFSPYWNIPGSIVEDEILPAMKKNQNYLQKHHMEIVKKNDSLPVIRQVPGPDNPLGRVKFLFPNSYDIFFHDTPKKELFEKEKRAYSHGCIRLEDAKKLAVYLLKDDASWTPEKIEQAMNSGKEQFVRVKKSVPVMITYFTTWVDENGQLNFRDDVYQHDQQTRERLFTTATLTQPVPQKDSAGKDTSKTKI